MSVANPLYLDDLISDYYVTVGRDYRSSFVRGQIFWIPVAYAREDLQVWRPSGLDASATQARDFRVQQGGQDLFKRSTPLHTPRLETNEEFLVVRAKRRPVILACPAAPVRSIQGLRQGGRINRPLCMVVPVFSLINRHTEILKYPTAFIERMRRLEFPEFFFLPEKPGAIRSPSYARICDLQAVYQPHLEPLDLRLSPEVWSILAWQIVFNISGKYDGDYQLFREQLLNQ